MLASLAIIINIWNQVCVVAEPETYLRLGTDLYHEELKKNYNINLVAILYSETAAIENVTISQNSSFFIRHDVRKVCLVHKYPPNSSREASKAEKIVDVSFVKNQPTSNSEPLDQDLNTLNMIDRKASAIAEELLSQRQLMSNSTRRAGLLRANLAAYTVVSCLAYLAGTYMFVKSMKRKFKQQRI